MKEILFMSAYRAKLSDNGDLVYWDMFGQLVGVNSCLFNPLRIDGLFYRKISEIYSEIERISISKNTGSIDNKKKVIFEGDILKAFKHNETELFIQ